MEDTDYLARKELRKEIESSCIRIIREIADPNLKFIELVQILNNLTSAESVMLPFN